MIILFYGSYAILLLILSLFLVRGTGCMGFFMYMAISLWMPLAGPLLWAWNYSTLNRKKAVIITLALHLAAVGIILTLISS